MAISYEALLPEILPMVPGCPDTLIKNSVRAAVIELCEKASVYQTELDPITTVSGIYEYDLEAPAGTVVHKILWATHDGRDLEPLTTTLLGQRLPRWREDSNSNVPLYFVKQSSALFWLAPIPSTTAVSSTIVRAVLKPTHGSTSCDSDVMNDYREAIINGALTRLLRMPSKDWTDSLSANTYGALFYQATQEAERRARSADSGVARKVNYGGLSSSRRASRNRYGREYG